MKKIKDKYLAFINTDLYISLLSHFKNYLLSSIAVKSIAIISMPVMTRLLSPEDYGVYNIFLSYVTIFVPLLSLNIYAALGRYYYEEDSDLKTFLGTSIISVFVLLFFWGGVFYAFSDSISKLIGLPVVVIKFIVPSVLFYVVSSWFEQIHVAQKNSWLISRRDMIRALFMFAAGVVCVLYLEKDKYLGMIYSTFFVGLASLIYYGINLKQYINYRFSKNHLRYMLNFSIPLIPSSISGVILAQFDRVMINNMYGASETGLYSIAYNVALLLTIVITSLHLAWMPDYYKLMNKRDFEKLDSDADRILRIVLIAALGLIYFSREMIFLLAAPRYHDVHTIVPIIIIGYVLNSFFSLYSWGVTYEKKNMYLTIITFLGGGGNVLLNYLLLPRFGYIAAAYTTTISFGVMAVCAWGLSKFVLKIYYFSSRRAMKQLLVFSAFVCVYYLLKGVVSNNILIIISKSLLVLVYTGYQVYVLGLDRNKPGVL